MLRDMSRCVVFIITACSHIDNIKRVYLFTGHRFDYFNYNIFQP